MNYLYLLTQDERTDYDTYDSCVVCASSEKAARKILPDPGLEWHQHKCWATYPNRVKVTLLGTAKADLPIGVILASFNAS